MNENKNLMQNSSFSSLYSDVLRYFMKGTELTDKDIEAIQKVKEELSKPFSGRISDL